MTYVLEPPQQLTLLFARIYNKYMHEKCVHVWLNVCNILHNKLNSCKIQPHFQLEFFIFSVCDVLVLNGYSTSQICWVWLVFFSYSVAYANVTFYSRTQRICLELYSLLSFSDCCLCFGWRFTIRTHCNDMTMFLLSL